MLPVVTIIGRPNVGKSMLFNRLTKTKNALVLDLPGTTRDRQYGEAQLGEQTWIVIDTGGVGLEHSDLDFSMAKQSWLGVMQANLVLFVVDGASGVIAADLELAAKLRQLAKPLILVVNKTDCLDPNLAKADFFSFGLGEPVSISALHNRGFKQLTDYIESLKLNLSAETVNSSITNTGIKVAIVGKPNVGKSTLINCILQEERVVVSDIAGTTRDSILVPFTHNETKYILIDTAGVRQRSKVKETLEKFSIIKTLQAIEESNVSILLIDASQGITDQDLTLAGFIAETGKGLVLAFNKADLLSAYDKQQLIKQFEYKLGFINYAEQHFISALTGQKVKGLFSAVLRAYHSATKRITTPLLTKTLQKIVEKHTPPMVGRHRIKLRYAHSGGYNPPRIVIHGTQTDKLPNSYKRYLGNAFREQLKIVGTPIFFEFKNSVNPYVEK